ncbi:MAG TPA: class I SAM-dependent RNA methyltransferase [Thermodesulfobacteriota bacterium]|nr:class I SAM-dependent RNA methyltransferase [Thermodesulfobacteriota bacterium]
MSFWTEKSRIVVTCAKGVTPFLKQEVHSLGFPVLSEGRAEVETEGTMVDTLRLNLLIRTGQRVLFLVDSFHVETPDELYRKISRIRWEDYIPEEGYFSVTSSVQNPSIKDSRYPNVKCKDAVVDRIKEKRGRRPDTGSERDRVVIHLYWRGNLGQVYLDTSGEPLSKRGYRMIPLKAPMQETLAAAVILATGWIGKGSFINPMCGSGTLAIEAALLGLGRAPGLLRNNFGFMHLKGFDGSSWKNLRRKVRADARDRLDGRMIATDINQQAVEAAKKNAMTAGVERFVEFGVCDFSETPVPDQGGVVVLNPEYGDRMGEIEGLGRTYRGVGDFLKKKCHGYRGYVFTGNLDLAKKVGLRTKRRILFYNGPIECRLLEYDLYEGSKRKVDFRM